MAVIFAFGMSTTYGAWDIEGGWVQRLRSYLDKRCLESSLSEKYWYTVYNLGISGGYTSDLLARFEAEIKPRLWEDEENIIIINTGKNDALIDNSTGQTKVSLKEYTTDLEKIVTLAKKYSKKILIVGSLLVDESKVDPVPWLPGFSYKNDVNHQFDQAAEESARKMSVPFLDLFSIFKDTDYQSILEDGVHPNSEGHKQIFEMVKDTLEETGFLNQ